MDKLYKYLPAGISLFAGLVVSVLMLINRADSLKALICVFCFLLGFYILGLIFRAVLLRFETKPAEEPQEEQTEDISTESDKDKK